MWKDIKLEGAEKSHVSVGQFVTTQFLSQNVADDPSGTNPTVSYFHEKLNDAMRSESRMRKRLDFLHKLENQLSLLLNKALTARYGSAQTDQPLAPGKSVVPPLPPGDRPKLGDILRILHSLTPEALKQFMERSKNVEFAEFGECSVFNDPLLNSVLRTAPASQIAFLEAVVGQTKACGEFFRKLMGMVSRISLAPELQSEMTAPRQDYEKFLKFYRSLLYDIAKLAGAESCKVVFVPNSGKELIFPVDSYTYVLDVDDSLAGFALKKMKVLRIDDPKNQEVFESVSECELFEVNDPVVIAPFGVEKSKAAGLLVFSRSTRFDETDEFVVKVVAEYLSPGLKMLREVFTFVSPRHLEQLMTAIADMRGDVALFDALKEKMCLLTSAACCKFYSTGSYPYYENVPVLPPEPSLARRSKDSNIHFAYHNPRTFKGFNRDVDDELSLAKITSMLVVPVKGTPLMIVLYNATKSNVFTQVQIALAVLFAASLVPIVHEHTFAHQMDKITKLRADKRKALEEVHNVISPLLDNICGERFFDTVNQFLPKGITCTLFLFANETDAFRVPDNSLVRATDNMLSVQRISVLESNLCPEIECGGGTDIKSLLIVPDFGTSKSMCIFASHDVGVFSVDENTYLARLATVLLLLLPSYVHWHQLNEVRARHEKIRRVTELAMENLSSFVGADVECHYFETPLTNEPELGAQMTVSIETPRGIEAALTCATPIQSSTAKDAIVSFAEWMSSILAAKAQEKAPLPELITFFSDNSLEATFGCSSEKMRDWLVKVTALFESNSVSTSEKYESLLFLTKLLAIGRWSKWFTTEEKLMLALLTYLTDLDKIWRCRVDQRLLSEVEGCRSVSGPFLACVFGSGFGLADSLSAEMRKRLISILNDFAVDGTVQCQTQVLAHVKLIAEQGIKCTPDSKRWLGKALILLVHAKTFADGSEEAIEHARSSWSEEKQARFTFTMEKVYIPIMTYLARADDSIFDIVSHTKRAIRLLRAAKK